MAANKHPLDLFRATKSGFDSATRDPERGRRRVAGRVLVSTPREDREDQPAVSVAHGDDDEAPLEAPEHDVAFDVEDVQTDVETDAPPVEAASPTAEQDDTDSDDDDDTDDAPSEDGPANALEAILAQRRALEAAETPDADAPKPRRRVDVPPKPLQPVGLETGSNGPASVSRPLNQIARPDAAALPPGITSKTRSLSYGLLAAAGALIVVLVAWGLMTGGDEGEAGGGEGPPPLAKAAAANAGTDVSLGAATPSEYTVQAAVYGSNLAAAQSAADALDVLGFPDVELTGVEDGAGGFTDITLIVGRAADRRELETLRDRLRHTPVGKEANPFYTAFIVGHPAAE